MTKTGLIFVSLILLGVPVFSQSFDLVNPDSIPFAQAVNYGVGDSPPSVFCADLDGDTDLDLAVANIGSDSVSILKNNGDGTFQAKVDYGVGDGPMCVFCADLDGDTDLDLAVTSWYTATVSVLKNNGDGTFQTKVDYGVGGGPNGVFCADLDGDTDLDLAVANDWSDNVSILKNNGDGTFQAKVNYGVGDFPSPVFCADLDGDTDLDLAVGNIFSSNISILKNNGDGTFQTAVNYAVDSRSYSVCCADLDGDTDLDLVATIWDNGTVSVFKNNGDGTFQAKVDYGVGGCPRSVFCVDLDGDTDLDLVVANSYSDNVSILKNNGDGTFQTGVSYSAGDHPRSVFCADLDGDTDLDLAVANTYSNNVCILLNLTISPPDSFSLISPLNDDSVRSPLTFVWQTATDPRPDDTVRYDLHLSRFSDFDPDSTIDSLLDTTFTCSLDKKLWYWKVRAYDKWGAEQWSNQTDWSFYVYICGDVNGDGVINLSDVIYIANYLLKGGPAPIPLESADVNCDGPINLSDVIYLANYLLKGGPPPCEPPVKICYQISNDSLVVGYYSEVDIGAIGLDFSYTGYQIDSIKLLEPAQNMYLNYSDTLGTLRILVWGGLECHTIPKGKDYFLVIFLSQYGTILLDEVDASDDLGQMVPVEIVDCSELDLLTLWESCVRSPNYHDWFKPENNIICYIAKRIWVDQIAF